jgi:diguanylate cyclase
MSLSKEEIKRSLLNGEIAFNHLKQRAFSAQPRNYEVFYTYVSGFYNALSNRINELLSQNGALKQDDIDGLYESYLSPTRLTKEVDKVGTQVIGEITNVLGLLDTAVEQSSSLGHSLTKAQDELSGEVTQSKLHSIVKNLVQVAQISETKNQALEESLRVTREQFEKLQTHLEVVRNESLTDPLSQLYNRKYFDMAFEACVLEAAKNKTQFSLLLCDIDNFKVFNDTYGHLTGDHVIRLVAASLKANIKGQDTACRYGGEEFVILLPDTGLRSAVSVGENIRRAVMQKELIRRTTGETLGRVTLSIGIVSYQKNESMVDMLERADMCLYAAKRAGRNRVIGESDSEVAPHQETALVA